MKKYYIVLSSLFFLLLLPVILWYIEKDKELAVVIIDKSGQEDARLDHLGLTWGLNQLKVKTLDHSAVPILPESYQSMDVIYIAETGAAANEAEDDKNAKAHSSGKEDGLNENEWEAVRKRLADPRPSQLIAEYNTFASPTAEPVRKQLMDQLGVDWSGWVGRYFDELDYTQNDDIPAWAIEAYKEEWTYEGSGFLLVNDLNGSIVVAEENASAAENGLRMTVTAEGEKRLKTKGTFQYDNWFDIVTARPGAQTLARYEWSLTKESRQKLNEQKIPSEFAAVVQNRSGASESFYLAGDYNAAASVPSYHQAKGLPALYKTLNKFSADSFYWSAYLPILKGVLEGFRTKEEAPVKENVSETMQMDARINQNKLEVMKDGNWTPMTVKGVNIGMGKPGTFPGEAGIEEREYYRWFEAIGEMNANTVRVYTLHPPGFYRALKAYNESHEEPIRVMHGVWINEEKLVDSLDAFEPENLKDFQQEIHRLVDVVHGNADVEERPGHASGLYDADISEWVSAWMLGVEWDPHMVVGTNEKNADKGEYTGAYFETKDAAPFEHWLAEQMDTLVTYEVEKYRTIHPMSFTNWVTTDILDHPADSSEKEDLVSVDPNVIYTKNEMDLAGQFASYHVYPYYPDFLNYEKKYREFIDFRGKPNNYAAYLKELHEVHRLPILVAEFGIPASRGKTHENPFGWNQGFMSEKEQGEVLTHLFEDIVQEEMMGGLVFTWQDEWFKRTWNTMDYDDPDRRPFWSNAQTNEQQFGLLSFDRHKIKIDGQPDDWEADPLYEKEEGALKALYSEYDERYLYIRLDYDTAKLQEGDYPIIAFDTVRGQGNTVIDGVDGVKFQEGLEFVAKLNGADARLMIDPYYDLHHYLYGKKLGLIPDIERVKDSGRFIPIEYVLNKSYLIPNENRTIPFSAYETGKLKEGNGNPESKQYDSLADYMEKDGILELRIPWLLIQSKDPSTKAFVGNIAEDGEQSVVTLEDIGLGALIASADGQVVDSFPGLQEGELAPMKRYSWNAWDLPEYEERLKQSYYLLQQTFKEN